MESWFKPRRRDLLYDIVSGKDEANDTVEYGLGIKQCLQRGFSGLAFIELCLLLCRVLQTQYLRTIDNKFALNDYGCLKGGRGGLQ